MSAVDRNARLGIDGDYNRMPGHQSLARQPT
jgi:hypothetical protein